ncbi:histidine phosphatase superfamily [Cercophora newfieldiana]|uniref:Histidine phosphatase superfamily n=1 Tax=Cercophora newfieldiana TaxID=92897 RepID=A0AA39XRZ3_9PEZI|nr:histidine phosphatase superfamily [Cercophora newfieldiana]
MRLFLVRHGETVDNVAGLYAGVRDSPLTAHGVLQARRLAAHLASRSSTIGPVTHVFSSDLQRAANTAQIVIDAQRPVGQAIPDREQVRLVRIADLRERDFGSAEGKRFGAPHVDAETHEAMRIRADRFVRTRLAPVLQGHAETVVVVSHGLLLNALLRVLLARHAPAELTRLAASGPGSSRAEYMASWSNTGYLEMVVNAAPATRPSGEVVGSASGLERRRPAPNLSVVKVNSVEHLVGLKKTRGGIGSAQFDSRQKTMESFFSPTSKKRKAEE